ncbi:MAG: hypothetical protein M1816_000336 [Peltula sp. TS41687]|nr:MAG: hypothetical protein M1816_000336 [Peltula sp. TS41687]
MERYITCDRVVKNVDPAQATAASAMFACSLRSHFQLFHEVLNGILQALRTMKDPAVADVSALLFQAKELRDRYMEVESTLPTRINQTPPKGDEMPEISPVGLAIYAIFENGCHQFMPRREALSTLGSLDTVELANRNDPRVVDGTPKTIAVCVGSDETPHVRIGESRPNWQPRTFMARWSLATREDRLTESKADIEAMHHLFKSLVKRREETGLSRDRALVDVGQSPDPLVDLLDHNAQAIDGWTLIAKDRCVQCRKTFGFCWLIAETPLTSDGVGIIEWAGETDIGKCAENWLWRSCVQT